MNPLRLFPLVLFCLIGSVAQSAEAQRSASIQLGFRSERESPGSPTPLKVSDLLVRDSTSSRAARTSHGALVGAGIGAAAGTVAAFIATHNANVTDHSEDGLAYIGLLSFGAFVGLVVGGIVGFVRN
jgi:hypothetical protein